MPVHLKGLFKETFLLSSVFVPHLKNPRGIGNWRALLVYQLKIYDKVYIRITQSPSPFHNFFFYLPSIFAFLIGLSVSNLTLGTSARPKKSSATCFCFKSFGTTLILLLYLINKKNFFFSSFNIYAYVGLIFSSVSPLRAWKASSLFLKISVSICIIWI